MDFDLEDISPGMIFLPILAFLVAFFVSHQMGAGVFLKFASGVLSGVVAFFLANIMKE